jgi:uncharacterized protein YbjT (DUF2867 family)
MAGSVTVFGGTGFIGRHLVALLLRSGATVRLAVRRPGRVQMTTEAPRAPELIQTDVLDDIAVDAAIAGTVALVNLVGILTETGTQSYRAIHVEAARRVALAAERHGVTRLIHISALRSSLTSPAISDRTKAEGEQIVREVFPQATMVRPSLVFGEDGHFFGRFVAMI